MVVVGDTPNRAQRTAASGGGFRLRLRGRIFWELTALAVLAAVAVVQGQEALATWRGPGGSVTTELYIPAVSMAAGRGFTNIVPESVPELRRFLDFQAPSLDTTLLNQSCREQPLHPYQEYHRYLVMTVGWVWSVFGVSWDAMKLLLLLLLAVCLWEVYWISRLAMGPLAAFFVALAFSWCQPLLAVLGNLRDFSKAPFLLGAILVLGLIIRRPRNARVVLFLAAAAGAVLGIGLGFRRDAMVVVPFAALVLAFAPVAVPGWRRRVLLRASAIAVLAGVFCASGWPILKAFHEHGTLAAHDTIMGFSTNADLEMSLEIASYEKLYVLNDLYCSMAAHDAGRRGITGDPEEYRRRNAEYAYDNVLKERYILAMFQRFPADMVTRAYGACLRILGGIWGVPDSRLWLIVPYGAWFALVALAGVSMVNWRLATAMLAFVCFFAGYTSAQFSFRHAFYLEFAPLFFAAFVADRSVRIAAGFARRRRAGVAAGFDAGRGLFQATAWLVCVVVSLWGVLAVAGMWQDVAVDRLVNGIMGAEKVPVAHREGRWDDRVLFSPDLSDGCSECQNAQVLEGFRTTVYAVRIAAGPGEPEMSLCYDVGDSFHDFSKTLKSTLASGAPCDLWYCFPVFEPTLCSLWSRFVGVSLPKEQADRFRGFFRVQDPEDLDLLMSTVIPENPERLLKRQHLTLPWAGSPPPTFFAETDDGEVFQGMRKAAGAASLGDWHYALTSWNAVAACRPRSLCAAMGRVEALEQLGRSSEGMDVLTELLAFLSGDGGACARVDDHLLRVRGMAGRLAAWRELATRLPDDACVRRHLEKSALPAPSR